MAQKLKLLSDYLGHNGGFLKATNRARQRYYVDLFAGPGQVAGDLPDGAADGSPLISLKAGPPAFTRVHWVEKEPQFVASLRAHKTDNPERDIRIFPGDANELVDDVLSDLPRNFPVFAFLDPRGPELEWRIVEKLARHKARPFPKVELLLLFAYNTGIVRLMPLDPSKMENEVVLDRFMPDRNGWRRIYEQRSGQTAGEYRRSMLAEYVKGLEGLGYKFVPPPYLVTTQNNHPLYFLIFATDHPAGWKIMTWCLNHLPDIRQQLSYLPYTDRY